MDSIETICANSYRNFHAKGLDYLCISRSSKLTRKVYFFEGDLAEVPEIVVPHDHRYAFVTTVLAGAVHNLRYNPVPNPHTSVAHLLPRYDQFAFNTPLNGGDGFSWEREVHMFEPRRQDMRSYGRGAYYRSMAHEVHTLDVRCEGTVILIEQLKDEVPIGVPTKAYRKVGSKNPPNLSGLYDTMDADQAVKRIAQFLDLIGNR